MEYPDIVNVISTVGFPISCCVILMYYVKYTIDKFNTQLNAITEKHATETSKMMEIINNNTNALNELKLMLKGGNN